MTRPKDSIAISQLSPLEEMLKLAETEPDVFTTTADHWRPPGGRGIYGGSIVAQSLVAAQQTVRDGFLCHSMHCQFLVVGNETIPATFSVQRTRDGGSFATRTVQGTQQGKCIFTSTLSFMRKISSEKQRVQHAPTLPSSRGSPPDESLTSTATAVAPQLFPISIENSNGQAEDAKLQTWIRASREVAQGGDVEIQQAILAYLSDWVSISITPYVLGLFDFPGGFSKGVETSSLEGSSVGMLSSLGHTIYFHAPARIRADEWILLVGNSPWSGDERCLASARMFAKDGTLLATYFQEGVIRLNGEINRPGVKL
ncbi:acylthioesterase ii [Colletotrichum kahawae]|uniref:Acylthioesterase ii n=1 Tax=Colletotrichum kahawae TaxID=34407 RepID=A0AAD9YAM2_COLKA|nr:acylthioesterase ii [Colletotrichum kahawae]